MIERHATLVLFNKPFGVLSQFTSTSNHPGLEDYLSIPDVYPAGRLDHDSEGLLLLTDNGALQARISHPRYKLPKTYWVQVEHIVGESALHGLRTGVDLKDGKTLPATARVIPAPDLWPRTPPIRDRKSIPTCWLELTIQQGLNRQIRRMTAAVGHPTLRLIRVRIGPWGLDSLAPGAYSSLSIDPDDPVWQQRPALRTNT